MSSPLQPCIRQIVIDKREILKPIVQVVEIKEMVKKEPNAKQRYRLAINDGEYFCPAMLSTSLSYLVEEEELKKFNYITIDNYSVNNNNNKPLFIILDLTVRPEQADSVVGNPENINNAKATEAAPPPPPSAPAPVAQVQRSVAAAQPPPPPKAPQQHSAVAAPPSKPKPARPPQNSSYFSISSLTAYIPSWTILARIVQKTPMKTWTNQRGKGSLFSVTLKDKAGDEIRGTFFNEVAELWIDKIEVEKVYIVTGGRIKMANTKFNNVKNEYEISFDSSTSFTESETGIDTIPLMSYDFVKISDLANKSVNDIVDIIGVVQSVEPVTEIHSTKTGKDLKKRNVTLIDDTKCSIQLTLWNQEAENFPSTAVDQIVQIKDAKVGEFHGKQISASNSSIIKLNQSSPEADALASWWAENKGTDATNLSSGGAGDFNSRMIFLELVNKEGLGTKTDTADYFTFYATLQDIIVSRNLFYLACPNQACKNKGVQQTGEGSSPSYFCKVCNKTINDPVPRYAFTAKFGDFSGNSYFSIMGDENGERLIGMKATEWRELTDNTDEKFKRSKLLSKNFDQYKIKAKAKTDSYQDKDSIKFSVQSMTPIDYGEAALFFADEVRKF